MRRFLLAIVLLSFPVVMAAQAPARCPSALLPRFETPHIEVTFTPPPEAAKPHWRMRIKPASCSGDDCGCGIEYQGCLEGCDPEDEPCIHACVHEATVCSVCCCCDEFCPPRCG